MIVLHDYLVRDTSVALKTSAVEVVRPSSVSTARVVSSLGLDFEANKYKRKTTTHKMKTIGPNVGSSSGEVNT